MSLPGILYLLLFQLAGELLCRLFKLSIPGPVIGMALLFIALFLFKDLYQKISSTSHALLKNMALFFVPAGVGIITIWDQIRGDLFAIILISTVGTLLTMAISAISFHYSSRRER